MKRTAIILALMMLLAIAGCSGKETAEQPKLPELDSVESLGDGKYACTFDGVEHDVIVYLPDSTENAPLVLMLHGYGGNAMTFRDDTHFEVEALPRGYAVAYVTGATDPDDRTSSTGWNSSKVGEGNDDVGFLSALAGYLCGEYKLDSGRVYAAGFSNGAFMTHRLAMDAGNVFSACVSVAGAMQESVWERRSETNEVGFFQITGERDEVVPKNSDGSARYSKAPAIEDVIDYWAGSNGLDKSEDSGIGKASTLTKYYAEGKRPQVWHLFVKNGYHSWPDESKKGIKTNEVILDFFDTQK